jgi:hypothetical protein
MLEAPYSTEAFPRYPVAASAWSLTHTKLGLAFDADQPPQIS